MSNQTQIREAIKPHITARLCIEVSLRCSMENSIRHAIGLPKIMESTDIDSEAFDKAVELITDLTIWIDAWITGFSMELETLR